MKKFLSALFCLLLVVAPVLTAIPSAPPIAKEVIAAAHETTYHIGFRTILNWHGCSGTAIAPHALLTATHCELGTDTLLIEGHGSAHISGVPLRDDYDHSILLLDGITFEHYAPFATDKLAQGDDVFVFGNPGEFTDLYRRGVFAGVQAPRGLAALFGGGPTILVFDLNGYHGDSGEAVFNADGKIVTVTSVGMVDQNEGDSSRIQFMGAYALHFTDAQLKQAASYTPPPGSEKPAVADDDSDDPGVL